MGKMFKCENGTVFNLSTFVGVERHIAHVFESEREIIERKRQKALREARKRGEEGVIAVSYHGGVFGALFGGPSNEKEWRDVEDGWTVICSAGGRKVFYHISDEDYDNLMKVLGQD